MIKLAVTVTPKEAKKTAGAPKPANQRIGSTEMKN